jgi:hypothetical protein
MLRIVGPYVATLSGGRNGFQDINPPTVPNGTQLMAAWHNDAQENLAALIEGVGITLSDSGGIGGAGQALQGIRRLTAANFNIISAATATLTADQAGTILANAASNAVALTLPAANAISGTVAASAAQVNSLSFRFFRGDATTNAVTIAPAGGNTLYLNGASVSTVTLAPYQEIDLFSDGASNWYVLPAAGRLLAAQIFTSSGTYTPTPGTNANEIEVQGAGGASGGSPATSSSENSCGGGGGSGAWAWLRQTSGISSQTVTVGAAGAETVGGNGGNGGATSFGAVLGANGGAGGATAGPSSVTGNFYATPGAGGAIGATGQMKAAGLPGGGVLVAASQGVVLPPVPGRFSGGYGAGGMGTANGVSQAAIAGLPGQSGIVIVRDYA